jgi:hypothetical protein
LTKLSRDGERPKNKNSSGETSNNLEPPKKQEKLPGFPEPTFPVTV